SKIRSNDDPLTAYAPIEAKNKMPAYRDGRGIRSSLGHSGASGRFKINSNVLPMNRLAISPQTRALSRCSSRGPGWIPEGASRARTTPAGAVGGGTGERRG